MNEHSKKVLVVGAGGFVGGFLVEHGLESGYEVWAGIRASTSRVYLTDKRIHFLILDFEHPDTLAPVLRQALPEGEKWDYIIYNLGATKCLRFSDFSRINYDCLRDFTTAVKQADMIPEKLLYISSLSVMGPHGERTLTPMTETMIPIPNTRYGASKLKAEMWLATAGIPYIVFRCTGIYGPRDHDYFLMFESIAKGFDFSVGYRRQELTFIYVADLARAVYMALEKGHSGETYNIAEDHSYSQSEFRRIAAKAVGRRFVMPVRVPLAGLKVVSAIAEKIGAARGKPSTLNSDKYNIMAQRNWRADVSKAKRDFGFTATTSLEQGVAQAVEWYKQNGWLK